MEPKTESVHREIPIDSFSATVERQLQKHEIAKRRMQGSKHLNRSSKNFTMH